MKATNPSPQNWAKEIAAVVREIIAGGINTTRGIADELNRRGVPTARNGRWHGSGVSRLLERMRLGI